MITGIVILSLQQKKNLIKSNSFLRRSKLSISFSFTLTEKKGKKIIITPKFSAVFNIKMLALRKRI